jgi:hypothetical protein
VVVVLHASKPLSMYLFVRFANWNVSADSRDRERESMDHRPPCCLILNSQIMATKRVIRFIKLRQKLRISHWSGFKSLTE